LSPLDRRYRIVVCRGPECGDRRGSRAVYDAFRAALEARGFAARCELAWQSCFGRCTQGPNVLVREITPPTEGAPAPSTATALYNGVVVEQVQVVVNDHIGRGELVQSLIAPPTRRLTGAPTP
jgi:(2Fe-2S) ferredoxin